MNDSDIRRLRYRMRRQGMLELDEWLASLEQALESGDREVILKVETIIAADTPELLAMMHGEIALPKELRPWLGC
jgi:succinate dehydrogenase flavin-adding protein (antitoxin of CptAB toxin-antitoxin module)